MDGLSANEDRAAALLQQLARKLDDDHGFGCMTPAIYDTAWLAMLSKPINGSSSWLFPQCFEYVVEQQRDDGSWASYASAIDGILNTAASLLCLQRHYASTLSANVIDRATLLERINRAKSALQRLLNDWDVASTVHVGFEILVPALLGYIQTEGVNFDFIGRETLNRINAAKLKKFRPEFLYGEAQLTALHSLEAFVGKVDFDKVGHHKIGGSFMGSPSSTAAYLMCASDWDEECEAYLREVVECGAGQAGGGVPSAWPSTTFETTWVVSTLLDSGFDIASMAPEATARTMNYLHDIMTLGKGTTGFAPGLGADADDTAKAVFILNLLGRPTSPTELVKDFEDDSCFKTYPLERDPSFSANVNCLIALLHAPDTDIWSDQISKILRFLCSRYEQSDGKLHDKWNISPYYSLMLLAQALCHTLNIAKLVSIRALADAEAVERAKQVLRDIVDTTLQSGKHDGSWGEKSLREETAYAAIALATASSSGVRPDQACEVGHKLQKTSEFLRNTSRDTVDYLWVEKVTFGSSLLSESYVLAALQLCLKARPETPSTAPNQHVLTNGVSHKLAESKTNGYTYSTSGSQTTPHINGERPNGAKHPHERTDSVLSHRAAMDASGCDKYRYSWKADNEQILLGPFEYLDRMPGKNLRGAFISACNVWLGVSDERLAVIKKVVQMLHTSSLLMDDIEDNSDLRRGSPVAHGIFGVPQTLNSANYVYFQALKEIRDLRNPEAMDVFVEELLNLHRGQGLDLYWRDSLTCPSEDEYLDMVSNKTGGLFRLAVRLMQAESSTGRDLVPFVDLLGIQYQICDDYQNLKSAKYTESKGYCDDLTEGKFSFPVIHSIHADTNNKELLSILKQKPREFETKKYAVEYMERTGSFEYTRQRIAELKHKVTKLIDGYERKGWGDAGAIRGLASKIDVS